MSIVVQAPNSPSDSVLLPGSNNTRLSVDVLKNELEAANPLVHNLSQKDASEEKHNSLEMLSAPERDARLSTTAADSFTDETDPGEGSIAQTFV